MTTANRLGLPSTSIARARWSLPWLTRETGESLALVGVMAAAIWGVYVLCGRLEPPRRPAPPLDMRPRPALAATEEQRP